jgi:hypothetical protein
MARLAIENDEIKTAAPDADVHHMIRRVGSTGRPDGTKSADEVDNDVRIWLQAGYRLAFVQSLGLEPNGVNILYIFVKEG